jgi:NADH-ubiquinone oxidoreductase chain 6
MNFFNLILEFLTFLAIISSLAVITSTNPIIAIIFLIILFSNAALYLIFIGFTFIGISYLVIYIGAITVLFLFIIMMISTEIMKTVEIGPEFGKLLPLSYTLAVLFLLLFILAVPSFLNNFSSYEIYQILNKIIISVSLGINDITSYFLSNNSNYSFINLQLFNNNGIVKFIEELINPNALHLMIKPDSLFYQNLQIQTIGQSIYGNYAIILIVASFLLLLAMVCPIILNRKTSIVTTS